MQDPRLTNTQQPWTSNKSEEKKEEIHGDLGPDLETRLNNIVPALSELKTKFQDNGEYSDFNLDPQQLKTDLENMSRTLHEILNSNQDKSSPLYWISGLCGHEIGHPIEDLTGSMDLIEAGLGDEELRHQILEALHAAIALVEEFSRVLKEGSSYRISPSEVIDTLRIPVNQNNTPAEKAHIETEIEDTREQSEESKVRCLNFEEFMIARTIIYNAVTARASKIKLKVSYKDDYQIKVISIQDNISSSWESIVNNKEVFITGIKEYFKQGQESPNLPVTRAKGGTLIAATRAGQLNTIDSRSQISLITGKGKNQINDKEGYDAIPGTKTFAIEVPNK